jgi:hypothetical protein
MTRRYGETILVSKLYNDAPHSFLWHGMTYQVIELLGSWHLRDRWWESATAPYPSKHKSQTLPSSDRRYYRLECSPTLICDTYFDSISGNWILDRVYD